MTRWLHRLERDSKARQLNQEMKITDRRDSVFTLMFVEYNE